jgi:hypothetical protein
MRQQLWLWLEVGHHKSTSYNIKIRLHDHCAQWSCSRFLNYSTVLCRLHGIRHKRYPSTHKLQFGFSKLLWELFTWEVKIVKLVDLKEASLQWEQCPAVFKESGDVLWIFPSEMLIRSHTKEVICSIKVYEKCCIYPLILGQDGVFMGGKWTTKPILWVSHTPFQHGWNNIDILRNLATDFSVYLNWSQTKTHWDISDYVPFLKAMNEITSSKEWNGGRINNYHCISIAFKHLLAHVFYNTKI